MPSFDLIQQVLDTWFGAPGSPDFGHSHKRWFKKTAAFDAMLADQFGELIDIALTGGIAHWPETPLGALASILVLDQFTRNCFRGTARAFAGDAAALSTARALVRAGADRTLPSVFHRVFAYMPFEHDESVESQQESVRLFTALHVESGDAYVGDNLKYAIRHADVIARFGRFPHRNAVLGRHTTPDEAAWLRRRGGF